MRITFIIDEAKLDRSVWYCGVSECISGVLEELKKIIQRLPSHLWIEFVEAQDVTMRSSQSVSYEIQIYSRAIRFCEKQ